MLCDIYLQKFWHTDITFITVVFCNNHIKTTMHLFTAAGTGVLHPEPRSWFEPDGVALCATAALQRGAAVGDV